MPGSTLPLPEPDERDAARARFWLIMVAGGFCLLNLGAVFYLLWLR